MSVQLRKSGASYFRDYASSNSAVLKNLFQQKAFINGAWVNAKSGKTFDVTDPATGEVIGTCPEMGVDDTQEAVESAKVAFQSWKNTSAAYRGKILKKMSGLMIENQEALARIMTAECGKPLAETRGEVMYAASFYEWYGEEARRSYGHTIPSHMGDRRLMTIKQPVGVCGLITPWNFPSAMITRKAGPALAAGCTIVSKPAEDTPYSALALAAIAQEAGVPEGVFNVVTASREGAPVIGQELCTHPDVRKISFTGSTLVGKILYAQAADTVKRVSLELGGNAPFVVFEDADIDAAVEGAMVCKFRASGQTCVCANRMFVHRKVYDEFVEKFSAKVAAMIIGHGFEDGVAQGPLINERGKSKVAEMVKGAGGSIVTGGVSLEGNFFAPTIIGDLTSDSELFRNEIFGPVAPIFAFEDEEEVIRLCNDTRAGLASYFYSRDIGRVFRVAEQLEYGMVAANTGILSAETVPFGGIKESGLGREGAAEGLNEYTETKYLCLGGM